MTLLPLIPHVVQPIASQSEEKGGWRCYVTGCNSWTKARGCEIDLAVAAAILSF
jgi:hypothetical protein